MLPENRSKCLGPQRAHSATATRADHCPIFLRGNGYSTAVRLNSSGNICEKSVSYTTERPHFQFSLSCIGEGNGNPLQCSCLENPRDGGAWWAAVYGVAQSRTRLKRLSSSSSSSIPLLTSFPPTSSVCSPNGSAVNNPPGTQETRVQSLGREDPLEKGMATHSSILA